MKDYTAAGEIIRGSRWPPSDDPLTIVLTRSTGWAGADAWTWELLLSRTLRAGTPDLTLTADSVAEDGTELTLTFHATPVETATLPDKHAFAIELKSTDGAAVVSYWDAAQGRALVRSAAGEG